MYTVFVARGRLFSIGSSGCVFFHNNERKNRRRDV